VSAATSYFAQQKKVGDLAEKAAFDVFGGAGLRVQWRYSGHRKDLEVGFPHGTEFIEVKNEDRFENSPSACVEMFQGRERRPSGIQVTEATVCVHKFGDMALAYRKVEMRLLIQSRIDSGTWKVVPFGKSDNCNCGVLVPQMVVALKPWAEWLAFDQLPNSRVFKKIESPI
jgi:hypothetical protein